MLSKVLLIVATVFLWCSGLDITDEQIIQDPKSLGRNFMVISYNDDREKELRIAFRGVLVLETVAFEKTENEIHFLRVSDGKQIVQSVYQDGSLKDCDYSDESDMILEFVHEFAAKKHLFRRKNQGDVFRFYNTFSNANPEYALKGFKSRRRLGQFNDMVKIETEIRKCHKYVRQVKREQRRRNRSRNIDFRKAYFDTTDDNVLDSRVSTSDVRKPPEVTYIDTDFVPRNATSSGSSSKRTVRSTTASLSYKREDVHLLPDYHERRKRSFFNKYLIFPGTKWCGRGQIAQEYDELGEDHEADVCCREHDCCREIIPCFSKKYNYFNYRFHAILHCDCDREFRGCLKQSVSPMANLIGRIYFNIMGSKCFTTVMEDVCVERSWWGKCLRSEQQKTAKIEDQQPFTFCGDNK